MNHLALASIVVALVPFSLIDEAAVVPILFIMDGGLLDFIMLLPLLFVEGAP